MKPVLNLFFALATIFLWISDPTHETFTDLPRLFVDGTPASAVVERCEDVKFRAVSHTTRHAVTAYHTDYIPVAATSDGIEARGWFKSEPDWCERQLGKQVDVLIHPDDPGRSRINTYVQLWMLPVHLIMLVVIVFVTVVRPQLWKVAYSGYIAFVIAAVLRELYL